MDKIKRILGAYLLVNGKTKKDVYSYLGISANSLNSKLDGKTEFTFREITRLANLLNCSIDDLAENALAARRD